MKKFLLSIPLFIFSYSVAYAQTTITPVPLPIDSNGNITSLNFSGGIGFHYVGRVGAPTPTDGGAGSLTAGAHTYCVFAITALGRGGYTTATFTASGTNQVNLTWADLTDPNIANYGVAMSKAGTTTPLYIVTKTLASNASSYLVNTPDGSLTEYSSASTLADWSSGVISADSGNKLRIVSYGSATSGVVFNTGSANIDTLLAQIAAAPLNGTITVASGTGTPVLNSISTVSTASSVVSVQDMEDPTILSRAGRIQQNNSATANNSIDTIPLSMLIRTGAGNTGGLIFDTFAAAPEIFGYNSTEVGRFDSVNSLIGLRLGNATQGVFLYARGTTDQLDCKNFAGTAGCAFTAATVTATTFTGSGSGLTGVAQVLTGTSSSIGGGALLAGACATTTVSVTGATTAMVVVVDPVTYPGDGNAWDGYVSSADTVTVKVCAVVAGTPTTSTYNVRVIK